MIRTIAAVMRKELTESLRDRRALLTTLVFGPVFAPLFFILILKLTLSQTAAVQDESVPLTVVNAAGAPNLVQQLRESGLELSEREGSEADARAWIAADGDLVVLLIPQDFGERFRAGRPAPVQLFADGSRSKADRRAGRVARAVAAYAAQVGALRLQARGVSPLVTQAIVVDDIDVSSPSARATLVLGMLSYVILLVTLLGGLYLAIDATAGERERGSLESLLTMPARREHLVWGKVAASATMMLMSLALVTASITLALGQIPLENFGMSANFGPDVALTVFAVTAPFALAGAGLLTVVASFTRSYKEAQSWLGIVMLVPTVPIVFASVTGVEPSAPLMLVPSLSQHLVIQSLLRGETLPAVWPWLSVAGSAVLGLALAWLAGRLWRREALLG